MDPRKLSDREYGRQLAITAAATKKTVREVRAQRGDSYTKAITGNGAIAAAYLEDVFSEPAPGAFAVEAAPVDPVEEPVDLTRDEPEFEGE